MDFIYRVSVKTDAFDVKNKAEYRMRIFKYQIKSETDLNYILIGQSGRVKKDEIGKIKNALLQNGINYIGFEVWILSLDFKQRRY